MTFWHQHRPPPPLPPNNQGFGGIAHPTLPNQGYQAWPTAPQGQPLPPQGQPLPSQGQPLPPPGYMAPCNMPAPPAPPQFYLPTSVHRPPPLQPALQFPENNNASIGPPLWMNSVPSTQPVNTHTIEKQLEEESKDDIQLKSLPQWLQNKVKLYESSLQTSSIKKENAPIAKASTPPLVVLREALEALETLKQLETLADSLVLCGNDEQWSALMQHVEVHQAKLKSRCQELSKEDILSRLLASVERRRKKRERLKRRRVRREQEAQEHDKHVAMIEAKINARRQQILEKANQERQEEEMKEEVDSILGEIRFKISRTREYLEKLEAMKQLRAARKESYQQKGLYVAPEADSSFEEGISSVQQLLEGQLSDYLKEETALKVMLETEQKEQYESNKLANKQAAVLKSLFGSTEVDPEVLPFNKLYTSSSENLDSLAWVRNGWDRFLVPPDHPAGSSVPVQWVVPQEPSSHSWAMYCAS